MAQKLKQPDKIRVPMEKLEDVGLSINGHEIYHHLGQLFTGYLVMDYHPNGNVMFEEEYKNGEHLGWDNEYFENGNLKYESLNIGTVSIEFYEYDINSKQIKGGRLVRESVYNKLIREYNLLD